jgi:pimeloyl-ACP methyl ester carboxylesterase
VVVRHGIPGLRLFAALLADVAADAGVRLLVPDRPGYGRFSPPPDGWTWWDWLTDLSTVLDAESVEWTAVLGFSGGGPFALAAATGDRPNPSYARRAGRW